MEDISHSDVQFDDEKWVQGRKTKRTTWQLVPVEMSLRTAVELQEDAVERMWTLSTNSECVKHGSKTGVCLIVLNQWADCGKHDLQEAKKLEAG